MSSGPEKMVAFLDRVHMWISLWMTQFELAIVDCTWLLGALLNLCTDFQFRIMPVFNTASPEGPKITTLHCWPSALYDYTDFLRFSEYLIISCTIDGQIFKVSQFYVGVHFSELVQHFHLHFSADCWNSAHLYFWETTSVTVKGSFLRQVIIVTCCQ